jgi:UDP-glucose 4-epimerase
MVPEPCSPYAITKLDGEHYLSFYEKQFGLSCAALRFFNVFGPRQNPNGAYASAVPVFISRSIRNEDIKIFGDGEQTRDFIYVKDIVGALSFLAERKSLRGVFNAGYGESRKIGTLAEDIVRLTASGSTIKNAPVRPGDVKHSYASSEKLLNAGWVPRWRFPEALEETIAYYQEEIERMS